MTCCPCKLYGSASMLILQPPKTFMTDRGPPTFGGGKFPKQAISSVTHVVLLQNEIKTRRTRSQRVPKSQEFLEEDDWLLLMSPKGQTAHQNLLTNLSACFLPRFAINAHAISSDAPFTGWGTATCLSSAASSPNRQGVASGCFFLHNFVSML